MEQIHLIIAPNLKAFSEEIKLSLERVAGLTCISKALIGKIEWIYDMINIEKHVK